ncbi:acetylneuraminic acid synthetase [Candidatus Epulonipiscium fishelsonii]|uniref:Acetylneuraminic acid synthetase n=1 Tax=Candidatus Epulonipiscium fishelsonii TaxID=77094 RepID=A0ACC8XHR8_9FIRM|nr:acetylneuraminic acid synthetase [Epulopiscium sp. SCG-B05WGA-EpuloA1]ONI42992.1 acetylneuraminic acid synthetase [Epulopiscium sp. SCG-B11WGA-EpuloA1]
MNKPYIIAEIGVNFYDTAKELNISLIEAAKMYIKAAKLNGANAVKFQSYKADTIVSKNSPAYWDISKEPTRSQYELFQKHDLFNINDYKELFIYCKSLDVEFMSTPFDFASVDYLDNLVDIYKISSSDLTNLPFIEYIAKKNKPIFLSTGASYISEIEEAVRLIQSLNSNELCIMHCVLSYPTKNEDANLSMITHLKNIFPNLKIGYSDHTQPDSTMTVLTTAYLLGAEVIEKHFTLNKNLTGNDHYHAMDPSDLNLIVNNLSLVQTVLGKSYKTVLDCEVIPRREARRSIVINNNLKEGDIIKKEDIMLKRPGIGISPKYMDIIIGKKVLKDIEKDTILTWEII